MLEGLKYLKFHFLKNPPSIDNWAVEVNKLWEQWFPLVAKYVN